MAGPSCGVSWSAINTLRMLRCRRSISSTAMSNLLAGCNAFIESTLLATITLRGPILMVLGFSTPSSSAIHMPAMAMSALAST